MNDTSDRAGNGMDDMKRLKDIYAATPRDEPPAALDAAILAKAQAALVETGAQVSGGGNSAQAGDTDAKPGGAANDGYWRKPFAAAAMLVITASLAVLMNQEKPEVYTPEIAPAAPAALQPERLAARDEKGAVAKPASKMDFNFQRTPEDMPARSPSSATVLNENAKIARTIVDSTAIAAPAAAAETEIPSAAINIRGGEMVRGPMGGSVIAGPPARTSSAEVGSRDIALMAAPRERNSLALTVEGGAQSPEAMLARVQELRKNGQMKEAAELLDELRKRYPAFTIPPELR